MCMSCCPVKAYFVGRVYSADITHSYESRAFTELVDYIVSTVFHNPLNHIFEARKELGRIIKTSCLSHSFDTCVECVAKTRCLVVSICFFFFFCCNNLMPTSESC